MADDKTEVETNGSIEPCSHILVKLSYNTRLILPIDKGLEFIQLLTHSLRYHDDYSSSSDTISKIDGIEIKFLSELDINSERVRGILKGG